MRFKEIPYEDTREFNWTDIPVGIAFTFSLLAIGLAIALFFRPLYYGNISWQDLSVASGYSAEVIRENYDALIDYCNPFFFGDLVFPSIPSSESAISHFAEVKVIFNIVFIIGFISTVACVVTIFIKHKAKKYYYMKVSAITIAVLPVIVGIFSAISFDTLFNIFHKITFSNDDWLFDPATDPIILMLPESYFLQCALIIVAVMLAGTVVLGLRYRYHKLRKKEIRLLPKKKNYYYF